MIPKFLRSGSELTGRVDEGRRAEACLGRRKVFFFKLQGDGRRMRGTSGAATRTKEGRKWVSEAVEGDDGLMTKLRRQEEGFNDGRSKGTKVRSFEV